MPQNARKKIAEAIKLATSLNRSSQKNIYEIEGYLYFLSQKSKIFKKKIQLTNIIPVVTYPEL